MKTTTDLFSAGYRCELSADGAALVVITPEERRYRVNLTGQTCSCPAGFHGAPCKHLREARILALAQVEALWEESGLLADTADLHRFYTKWGGVMGYKAEGQRLLREAKVLRERATALYEWAHQEVSARQSQAVAA